MSAPEQYNLKQKLNALSKTLFAFLGLARNALLPISIPIKPLLFGFLIIIALLLLLLVSVLQRDHDLQSHVGLNELDNIARLEADHLEKYLRDTSDDLARIKLHANWLLSQNRVLDKAEIKQVFQPLSVDLSLRPLQHSHYFAFESYLSQRYFKTSALLVSVFKDIHRLGTPSYDDPQNMTINIWDDNHYLKNNRELWYHQNKKSQNVQISKIFIDKNYTKAQVFSVTQGLYDGSRFQGMVGIHIVADNFLSRVENVHIGKTGGAFLLDRNEGLVLSKTASGLLDTHERMQYNLLKGARNESDNDAWQNLLSHKAQYQTLKGNNYNHYAVFSIPLQDVPWTLVVYQDVNELGMAETPLWINITMFSLVILTLLVSWLFWQKLLIPLRVLITSVEQGDSIKLNALYAPGKALQEVRNVASILSKLDAALNKLTAEKTLFSRQLQECEHKLNEENERATQREGRLAQISMENQKIKLQFQKTKNELLRIHGGAKKLKLYAKKVMDDAQHARLEAEAANRTKSQFLANMNHELRTPMNAIIGYTEILQEDAEELGHYDFIPDLQKIHGASYHLLDLINNLFDLSKIESSKMDLYLETFDIAPMLQDVANTVQPLVEKQDNILKLDIENALGTMNADLTKLRQNLLNLLSNASKFSKQGIIILSARRDHDNGLDWVSFKISDQGIGMTPEQIKKLFHAFSQVDTSATRKYGGSGIGLAITKQFCHIMGGDIHVESEFGRGSAFTIRLPADVGHALKRKKTP